MTPVTGMGRIFASILLCLASYSPTCVGTQLGLNKIELLQLYLGTSPAEGGDGNSIAFQKVTQAMAEKALDDAQDVGATFVRVAVAGTLPFRYGQRGDLDLWEKDPESYWKVVDGMMIALRSREIKIVPVFVWNLGQFPVMTDEKVDALLKNPNSRSWKLLKKYVSEFVSRYKDNSEVLFYELGNEFDISVDLDLNQTCTADYALICGAKANYSSADLIAFTKRFSELIRSIDHSRKISSGFAVPRPAAEHLRQQPQWSSKGPDWTKDTVAELERNLSDMHQFLDIISVHLYPLKENQRFGAAPGMEYQLIQTIKQIADRIGKPLFVGEFGDMDTRNAVAGSFSDQALEQVIALRIPYAAMWGWELYIKNTYTSYDRRDTLSSLEPGNTDYLIGRFRQATTSIGTRNKVSPKQGIIQPRVVLTWPLECTGVSGLQKMYAVASDRGGAVQRVDFLVNGIVVDAQLIPPYQTIWNAKEKSPGEYTFSARAYDHAGGMSEYSSVVLVNIEKGAELMTAKACRSIN